MGDTESSFGEPTGQVDSSFDVDSALSSIEAGEKSGPAEPGTDIPQGLGKDSQQKPPTAQELAFKWKDTEIKVPYGDPRAAQWASQGYDYSQRMEAYNQERKQFDSQVKQYKEINEVLTKNPQIMQQIMKAVQGGQGPQAQAQAANVLEELGGKDNPFVQKMMELESKLTDTSTYIDQIKQDKLHAEQKAEDAKLDETIKSTREKYKSLDWDSFDPESGANLERKVLEHASKIGTQSFEVAFKDLMHEDLVKRAQEEAKQATIAELQQNKKRGLLGTTPTPTKGFQPAKNIKTKSYNDLANEAIAELSG